MKQIKEMAAALTVIAVLLYIAWTMRGPPDADTRVTPPTQPSVTQTTLSYEQIKDLRGGNVVEVAECEAKTDPRMRGICLRDAAVGKGDPKLCGRIEREQDKDNCYYRIALDKRDASLCDEIGAEFIRDACKRNTGGSAGDVRSNPAP